MDRDFCNSLLDRMVGEAYNMLQDGDLHGLLVIFWVQRWRECDPICEGEPVDPVLGNFMWQFGSELGKYTHANIALRTAYERLGIICD